MKITNKKSIIVIDITTKEDSNLKMEDNREVVEVFVVDTKNLVTIEIVIKTRKNRKIIEYLAKINPTTMRQDRIEGIEEEEEKILNHITNLQMMILNH